MSSLIFGFADPVFAWAAVFLAAFVVYGVVKRLFKLAVFLGIAAVIAGVVFLSG